MNLRSWIRTLRKTGTPTVPPVGQPSLSASGTWSLSLDTVHFSPSSPCHPCWDTFFVFTICFWPQPFLVFSPLESVDSAVCFYQLCPLPPYTSSSLLLSAQIVTRKSHPQSRGGDSVPSSGGPLPSAKACHLPIICCYTVSLPVLNGVV